MRTLKLAFEFLDPSVAFGEFRVTESGEANQGNCHQC
jgi:hypothetical protein